MRHVPGALGAALSQSAQERRRLHGKDHCSRVQCYAALASVLDGRAMAWLPAVPRDPMPSSYSERMSMSRGSKGATGRLRSHLSHTVLSSYDGAEGSRSTQCRRVLTWRCTLRGSMKPIDGTTVTGNGRRRLGADVPCRKDGKDRAKHRRMGITRSSTVRSQPPTTERSRRSSRVNGDRSRLARNPTAIPLATKHRLRPSGLGL
jgi:hypothetical protein